MKTISSSRIFLVFLCAILNTLVLVNTIYSAINDQQAIKTKVGEWFNAHNDKNLIKISSLYTASVSYYGASFSNKQCVSDKARIFSKHPEYRQDLVSTVDISKIHENEFTCHFMKRVTLKGSIKDYPSYLYFKNISGEWYITLESDKITDEIKRNKSAKKVIPKNAVKVDANGDGVDEYMWIVEPEIIDEAECKGPCDSYVKFSDTSIPTLKINQCLGGTIENLGDLNDDGGDEIGIYPDWFTSAWHSYRVWTLQNKSWTYPVKPFTVWFDHLESGRKMIRKDPRKKGYVIIRETEMDEEMMPVVREKSIKIKP